MRDIALADPGPWHRDLLLTGYNVGLVQVRDYGNL